MKLSFYKLASLFLLASACVYADGEIKDSSTGATFPSTVTFNQDGKDYTLNATGVATRKKFFVKVYSVAHYLQDGGNKSSGDKFQEILQSDKAKQLTIKWQRAVDAQKIQEGYVDSFKKTLPEAQYAKLQNDINKFNQFFNNGVQKDAETVIRWLPDGKIVVLSGGNELGSITNKEFAKALWDLWFGSKSVVDRNGLVSNLK